MKKYKVYDLCEKKEIVGYAETIEEVRMLANMRNDETNGYCTICYVVLNPKTNRYRDMRFLEVL